MLIAVVGARRNLGRLLVAQALERGFNVRAISPHMESGPGDPRVTGVAASDHDHDALVSAFGGVDAVVIVFPAALANPQDYPSQIERILDAVKDAGAPRVIALIGSAGALTAHRERLVDTDYFQETTRHFYQSIEAAWDVYRRRTDLDWVAFVPAARMQLHLADRGTYRTRTDEHLVTTDDTSRRYFDVSQISYGDCARAMLDEIEHPWHSQVFVTLGW